MSSGVVPSRDDFRFFEHVSTRWSDLDTIGHVNNTRFLTFDEQGRINYFRGRLGTGVPSRAGNLILARISCDFRAQLHHPSDVHVGIRVARIGETSLETRGAHFVGDQCVATTHGVLVWFDYEQQAKKRVPDSLRRAIWEFEVVAPEG